MIRTHGLILAILLLSSSPAAVGLEDEAVVEHREDATSGDFLGVWQGKWDGRWGVQFTVYPPAKGSELAEREGDWVRVEYHWEERRGEPWETSLGAAEVVEGVLKLNAIRLYLPPDDPGPREDGEVEEGQNRKATAVGNFRTPRTADLKQVPMSERRNNGPNDGSVI